MSELKWWQKAVFYQIYPRSFADGNGDGIGDFKGMTEKLDYLQDLGIDAIWLSPHYPSPMVDCGYDVANYTGVAPEYGSLDEFKRFLAGAHRRGIRVILDFVVNHTSDRHPWFLESASSRSHPKHDWYVWRDGKAGGPPNNWYSVFGGPAWEYVPAVAQFYYHFFFKEQPDLNWRNPEVKKAMFDAARFWLDLGVDGFRLDAIGTLFEDPDLRNHSAAMTFSELTHARRKATTPEEHERLNRQDHLMFANQVHLPEVHEAMQELRSLVNKYPDAVLVGETDDLSYHGDGSNELHLVFNFSLMSGKKLTAAHVRENQRRRLAAIPPGAWPCNTLGNHDAPRVFTRYGDGKNDAALARLSAAVVLTLKGTPFLYNGEEIGMTDLLIKDVSKFRDTLSVWFYEAEVNEFGTPIEEAVRRAAQFGRDKCRTPMQWANAPNGGFSPAGVAPWLPVNPNYAQGVNVAEQDRDPDSLLNFYRRLLKVRRETPALVRGDYTPLDENAEDYLAFLRRDVESGQTCLVVLNFSESAHTLNFGAHGGQARLLFSTHPRPSETANLSAFRIAPFEISIAELLK